MYSSKNISGVYFVKYFGAKMAFLAIYRPKSPPKSQFFAVFVHFEQHVGIFDSFDSLHHHPLPGTPPANSQCTKQFLIRPHGLYVALSE